MQFVEWREQGNALIKSRKGHGQVPGVWSANLTLGLFQGCPSTAHVCGCLHLWLGPHAETDFAVLLALSVFPPQNTRLASGRNGPVAIDEKVTDLRS